ncbi:MAG: ABC transporter ATP-binding protein, partial [Ardenticatenaceae bacterium]
MGFMRSLTLEGYDRDYSDRELLRRISEYFKPWRTRLLIIVIMLFLRSVFGAATPVLLAQGVERMQISGGEGLIAALMGVVLLFGFLIWLTNWVQRRLTTMLI